MTNALEPIYLQQYHGGGIAPNQVIVRSELEVHREMFTE